MIETQTKTEKIQMITAKKTELKNVEAVFAILEARKNGSEKRSEMLTDKQKEILAKKKALEEKLIRLEIELMEAKEREKATEGNPLPESNSSVDEIVKDWEDWKKNPDFINKKGGVDEPQENLPAEPENDSSSEKAPEEPENLLEISGTEIEPEEKEGDYAEVERLIKFQAENPKEPTTVATEAFLKKYKNFIEKVTDTERRRKDSLDGIYQYHSDRDGSDWWVVNGSIRNKEGRLESFQINNSKEKEEAIERLHAKYNTELAELKKGATQEKTANENPDTDPGGNSTFENKSGEITEPKLETNTSDEGTISDEAADKLIQKFIGGLEKDKVIMKEVEELEKNMKDEISNLKKRKEAGEFNDFTVLNEIALIHQKYQKLLEPYKIEAPVIDPRIKALERSKAEELSLGGFTFSHIEQSGFSSYEELLTSKEFKRFDEPEGESIKYWLLPMGFVAPVQFLAKKDPEFSELLSLIKIPKDYIYDAYIPVKNIPRIIEILKNKDITDSEGVRNYLETTFADKVNEKYDKELADLKKDATQEKTANENPDTDPGQVLIDKLSTDLEKNEADKEKVDEIQRKMNLALNNIHLVLNEKGVTTDGSGNKASYEVVYGDEKGKNLLPETYGLVGATKEELEEKIKAKYKKDLDDLLNPEKDILE